LSSTPYGLAVAVNGKKKEKQKCHARRLVWPCLQKGQNFKKNEKNVTQAIWSGRGRHRQKTEKQNMSRTPSGLAVIAIGQKNNEQKISCTKYGLAVTVI
jgi:hypothetical protein